MPEIGLYHFHGKIISFSISPLTCSGEVTWLTWPQVQSLHDVMFGRNWRILRSIAAEWVSLLSSVCFFIACRLFRVFGYLGNIQSSRGQGHARSRMLGAGFIACFQSFRNELFSCPEPLDHCLEPNECQIRNQWPRLYMTHYVSRSSKVIWGHMRSLTLNGLEW